MRCFWLRTATGLCLVSLLGLGSAGATDLIGTPGPGPGAPPLIKNIIPVKPPAPGCGKHGTTIDFVDTPSEAAKLAKKEGKLVFVLHVSGHMEDPRFL